MANALLAGVGKTAVYDLEHGKETIRLDTLLKILHVLNIKMQFSSPLMEEYNQKQREYFEQAIQNSQATQEQMDELAKEAKSGWQEWNKDRLPGLSDALTIL